MRHRQRWHNPTLWLLALRALHQHDHTRGLPGSQSQGTSHSRSGRAGVQDVSERGLFPFPELCFRQSQIGGDHGPCLLLGTHIQPDAVIDFAITRLIGAVRNKLIEP